MDISEKLKNLQDRIENTGTNPVALEGIRLSLVGILCVAREQQRLLEMAEKSHRRIIEWAGDGDNLNEDFGNARATLNALHGFGVGHG